MSEQFYLVQRWKLLLERQDELSSEVTFKGTLSVLGLESVCTVTVF